MPRPRTFYPLAYMPMSRVERIVELLDRGAIMRDVAAQARCSTHTVRQVRELLGLKPHRHGGLRWHRPTDEGCGRILRERRAEIEAELARRYRESCALSIRTRMRRRPAGGRP